MGPGEYPAVLKQGEGVFTPAQMAAMAPISGGVKVTVNNYGSSKIEVEHVSKDEIRIIAREEAKNGVFEHSPKVIAAAISDPNSTVSKSMGRNYKTARAR
jgi:hypothetical protein